MFFLVLLLLASAVPSHCATVVSLSCSSPVTPSGSFACVGVPIQCNLTLNATICNEDGNVTRLTNSDLTVQITEMLLHTPPFLIDQTGTTVVVTADYLPTQDTNMLDVAITSTNLKCSFDVVSGPLVVAPSASCNYPVSFSFNSSSPSSPNHTINGGEILTVTLELAVTDPLAVENVTLAYNLIHPALKFVSENTTSSNPEIAVTSPITTGDDHHSLLLTSSITPLVLVSSLVQGDNVMVNLHFQVQPYVLPQSSLYVSIHVFYHHSTFSSYSLKQSIDQLRNYTVSEVIVGNVTIDLPYYDPQNYEPDTFPSQEGDIFIVKIPILVPCVSTDLTLNILLPEFWSDFFTRYNVTVTNVTLVAPSNLMSIPHLCDYTDLDASMCDFDELSGTGPVTLTTYFLEQWAVGDDNITVKTGPLMYNITTGSNCAPPSTCSSNCAPPSTCSCIDEEIQIFLTVLVLTDMICENQTISDNITTTLTHTADMTTWLSPTPTHTEPTIIQYQDVFSFLHAVNASTPAISLPISSHSGDAGDPFTVTFGVGHNGEYSKFTAYDLNYTFSIDTRLDPEENISICFFDIRTAPIMCEEVPFINYMVVREGFHEMLVVDRLLSSGLQCISL